MHWPYTNSLHYFELYYSFVSINFKTYVHYFVFNSYSEHNINFGHKIMDTMVHISAKSTCGGKLVFFEEKKSNMLSN
mgnify:FL=1